MTDATSLSIAEAGTAMRTGRLTATELTQAQLDRIEALNPTIRAFVAVAADEALRAAQKADADFANGIDLGPMQGIGFAIKDIIDAQDLPTRCGSHVQPLTPVAKDADVVANLRAQGAIPLGKVATYEYALVGPSFDGPHQPAANPWNTANITGGSSSGSAAAVAAGMVRCAIGTDTGGSIRSPACYCGVVGLKPSFGSVSRDGVFPLSADLDHIGPLASTVEDAAIMAQAMGIDAISRLHHPVSGLKVGYARDWFAQDAATHPAVLQAMDQAMSDLSLLGTKVELIHLPDYAEIEAVGSIILQYQALELHRIGLNTGKYGKLAVDTLQSGQILSAQDLSKARAAAAKYKKAFQAVFDGYDAIATACVLSTAPPFSAFGSDRAVWTAMRTLPFNITGNPALAVPVGFFSGLPIGMQLVASNQQEATLLQIGHAYERATDHSAQRPML